MSPEYDSARARAALGERPTPRVWAVGALCRAIADTLEARFNPVTVAGEISGFSRAASGHCYFSLKDASGQLRCAMFRRAATGLDFQPRDGELVEVRGRLGVYEPRGDLQLIVESMRRAGQGNLFEQFMQLKAKLEGLGLFDPARKRQPSAMPRGIGVVTSLGAAALHDVMTALQRRVPHIPVLLAPASVQGEGAAREIIAALEALYAIAINPQTQPIDTILLVRGGGAMEDLWSFNDEQLAYTLARSPVPVICGVGHETDFTIADFVTDLRAPTPTAAAELVADSRASLLLALDEAAAALRRSMQRRLDREAQGLDRVGARIGRPAARLGQQASRLAGLEQRLGNALRMDVQARRQRLQMQGTALPRAVKGHLQRHQDWHARAELRLAGVNPAQVLRRGFAWMSTPEGQPLTSVTQAQPGAAVVATLADGTVDLTVQAVNPN